MIDWGPRKTAGKRQMRVQISNTWEVADLSIVSLPTGIQGDLERFLEAY